MKFQIPSRTELPKEILEVSALKSGWLLFRDWACIFGSAYLAIRFPAWYTFLGAQLIIASRQHALFLHMHEATHYSLSKNRALNDWMSNLFASWPVGFSTDRYRIRHWHHHRYLNEDKDPDWFRKKTDPTWQFPMSRLNFWRHSLAHLFGKGVIEMSYALRGIGIQKSELPFALPYYGALALALTTFGGWKAFALYWVLPYFTVLPFLHRVRNASDHLGLPKEHLLNGTRNIVGAPIESFFFGPNHSNLHLVHHLYPYIPWYHLPAAHEWLMKNTAYRDYAHINSSYLLPWGNSVYRDMTQPASVNAPKIKEEKAA